MLVDVCHYRLGHASLDRFKLLCQSFDYISFTFSFYCDVCLRAKQTQLSFNKSSTLSQCCFQLPHCDIWGSFSTPTSNESRYFLTILDDYSHCTWLYLMKTKEETLKLF